MKVFRNLIFRGTSHQLAAAVDAIHQAMTETGDWQRDWVLEQKLRLLAADDGSIYCFACPQNDRRPAASLCITQKDAVTFQVSNIVPAAKRQLSVEEYNDILKEFFDRFVQPALEKTGLSAELTESSASPEQWLSVEVAEKLRTFSASANKGTGSSLPVDRGRWNDFVVSAHRDGSQLDATTLRRWLIEIEGWPQEVAEQLAGEYEYGRELLAFAENGRRSA